MTRRQKLVVANWKMNPGTLTEARKLFTAVARSVSRVRGAKVVLCPPTLFLAPLVEGYRGTKVLFGAQDVSVYEKEGAHTGETSPHMLKRLGVIYSIVGHSERRAMGETNEVVSVKVRAALKARLTPVVCVGEQERDAHGAYFTWLERQISASLQGVSRSDARRLVVAYEPIWAIGKTARDAMTPEDVHQTVIFIKKILSRHYGRAIGMHIPILYGGSVEPANAGALVVGGAADGFLVGHASLTARAFLDIVHAI